MSIEAPRPRPTDDLPPRPEREVTDESLRVEREKADATTGDEPSIVVDEAADAVLETARKRADAVLAASRKKADRRLSVSASPAIAEKERVQEDKTVRRERADADAVVRTERADRVAGLEAERAKTDEDLARERTRSDDSVAARDDFLGVVSHDLRNMLGAMVGFAGFVAKEASGENRREQVLAHAQRIQHSGARMSRLIGDLLDVASIEADKLTVATEVADPTTVVTEALEAFQARASASGLSLVAEVVRPVPHIPLDSARILQVLVNLLSNAIKFTPRGGAIVVRVECAEPDLRFTVRDTGVGIPTDQLKSIFERFVQVRDDRRGMGLGLYISKCIVEGHGGRIWAESTLGQGGAFIFMLPLRAAS